MSSRRGIEKVKDWRYFEKISKSDIHVTHPKMVPLEIKLVSMHVPFKWYQCYGVSIESSITNIFAFRFWWQKQTSVLKGLRQFGLVMSGLHLKKIFFKYVFNIFMRQGSPWDKKGHRAPPGRVPCPAWGDFSLFCLDSMRSTISEKSSQLCGDQVLLSDRPSMSSYIMQCVSGLWTVFWPISDYFPGELKWRWARYSILQVWSARNSNTAWWFWTNC
jgi:hypothetical protein